jgi:hypothetical protein
MTKVTLIFTMMILMIIPLQAKKTVDPFDAWFNEKKVEHESEFPVFMQKSGVMRPGTHSFFLRTQDEWTGFSTFTIGYRAGLNPFVNISIEGGGSPIPFVFLGTVMLHMKFYESPKKFLFVGSRVRFSYKYQDVRMVGPVWEPVVGPDFLNLQRNGFSIAPDFTVAFRMGPMRNHSVYYTIYPRFDIDITTTPAQALHVYLSPATIGYEVRFGKRMRWNFAVEAGMSFPVFPTNLALEEWMNFPSLANVHLSYTIGDKFYSKQNMEKLRAEFEASLAGPVSE